MFVNMEIRFARLTRFSFRHTQKRATSVCIGFIIHSVLNEVKKCANDPASFWCTT